MITGVWKKIQTEPNTRAAELRTKLFYRRRTQSSTPMPITSTLMPITSTLVVRLGEKSLPLVDAQAAMDHASFTAIRCESFAAIGWMSIRALRPRMGTDPRTPNGTSPKRRVLGFQDFRDERRGPSDNEQ
eukprot:5380816-Pyramimonas_sp.AAC.1